MDQPTLPSKPQDGSSRGSLRAYILGFLLSLTLTLTAYILVARHVNSLHETLSHRFLIIAVAALAITQLMAQLIFFLHLGRESKPRWNLLVFSFMAIVLVILVGGSLWIMYNLNYHLPAHDTDAHILQDEGIKR